MIGLSHSLPRAPTAGRIARAAVRDRFTYLLNRNTVADLEPAVSELVADTVDHTAAAI